MRAASRGNRAALRRLRRGLAIFFLALAVPTVLLVRQAYLQLKWESLHQHTTLAEELARRIDARFRTLLQAEEARSFGDYAFLVAAGDPAAPYLQRSELSTFPFKAGFPGLLGYFQVDASGDFSSPLLPPQPRSAAEFGITATEAAQRADAERQVLEILHQNRLVQGHTPLAQEAQATQRPAAPRAVAEKADREMAPAPAGELAENAVPAQSAFDSLSADAEQSRLKKAVPKLEKDFKSAAAPSPQPKSAETPATRGYSSVAGEILERKPARKERSLLPELSRARSNALDAVGASVLPPLRVATFESELDPFEFNRLESGQFVLFRKVWRDRQRFIQGALLEAKPLLDALVDASFRDTALRRMCTLQVSHRGERLARYAPVEDYERGASREFNGEVLLRSRLSSPFDDLELVFGIEQLPPGPGAGLLAWLAAVIAVVLVGGFVLLHRVGARQIELVAQQQDFVAAVSHELKTPLTSIRMYGEMLREGWLDETKRKTYYQFICSESERLSRLIANVLQLSRLSRGGLRLTTDAQPLGELLADVLPKLASQAEQGGFELHSECAADVAAESIRVDADALAQILINWVDNAIKFAAQSPNKKVALRCWRAGEKIVVAVRDFGPGIPPAERKRIFELFVRLENEMTRETAGTGIGLALAKQLADAMDASIDVVGCEPGVEFRLRLCRAASLPDR